MASADRLAFNSFGADFVRAYWLTVKSGAFPMPPNEPVEETVEELLASVSHEIELDSSSMKSQMVYRLRMTGEYGAWWLFSFVRARGGWRLIGSKAGSHDPAKPTDMLDAVYGVYFEPFFQHITKLANGRTSD